MKNIRVYTPDIYKGENYIKVKDNIYKTVIEVEEDDNGLSLEQVTDEELLKELEKITNWKESDREIEEDYLIAYFNGKKYYKDIEDEENIIFKNMDEETEEIVYVTSIVFEPEPELNENQPSDKYVSQYPLEDILDKFGCYCGDNYKKENEEDPVNSYVEFVSDNLEEIENLLTIIGKHVYNKVDGEYVKLAIE
ncbi:MAG: hypothetical protein IK997_01535 [Bacilli bacterium]|nr:hypothetical protein [Bacilli bacterium]